MEVADTHLSHSAFIERLRGASNPAAAVAVDMTIELVVPNQSPTFVHAGDGRIEVADSPTWEEREVDVRYLFSDQATALELLVEGGDVMTAFMEERFRATGHIAFTYVLLGLFRNPSLPSEPPP